ncbi:MAG: TIGR03435 family protein [Candidatus Solibacter sp.]
MKSNFTSAVMSPSCEERRLPRVFGFTILAIFALPVIGQNQSPPATNRPAFEVASIKLGTSCGERRGRGAGFSRAGYSTSCVPLRVLIRIAYGKPMYGLTNPRQIEVLGGPAWLDSEVYDISAKGANITSLSQVFEMLQSLLEDRCKLKVHKETREAPIYLLELAKGGPKIRLTKAGACRPNVIGNFGLGEPPANQPDLQPCGNTASATNRGNVTKTGLGVTMDQFAGGMLASLDRPVANRTGLTGMFDIHLVYALDAATQAPPPASGVDNPASTASVPDPLGPSVFGALQDQLGLKLASARGPVDVLVIDHVERPSAN